MLSGCGNQSWWDKTTSPEADQSIVYEGNAVLSGWGVYVSYYMGEPELHFHVDPQSVKNLPGNFDFDKYDWDFKLENANDHFLGSLSKSNNKKQSGVMVDKITVPNEGHPLLHITDTNTSTTSPQTQ